MSRLQSHQSDVVLVAPHWQLEWQHPGRSRWRHVVALRMGGSYRPRGQTLLHQVSNTTIGLDKSPISDSERDSASPERRCVCIYTVYIYREVEEDEKEYKVKKDTEKRTPGEWRKRRTEAEIKRENKMKLTKKKWRDWRNPIISFSFYISFLSSPLLFSLSLFPFFHIYLLFDHPPFLYVFFRIFSMYIFCLICFFLFIFRTLTFSLFLQTCTLPFPCLLFLCAVSSIFVPFPPL